MRLKSPYLSGSRQGSADTGNGAVYVPQEALHGAAERTEDTRQRSPTGAGLRSPGAPPSSPARWECREALNRGLLRCGQGCSWLLLDKRKSIIPISLTRSRSHSLLSCGLMYFCLRFSDDSLLVFTEWCMPSSMKDFGGYGLLIGLLLGGEQVSKNWSLALGVTQN